MSIRRNGFRFRSIRSNLFLTCLIFITVLSILSYRNTKNDGSTTNSKTILHKNKLANFNLNILSDTDELISNRAEVKQLLDINNLGDCKTIYPETRKFKFASEIYTILEYTNVFFKPKFCDKKVEDIFNSELETCEYSNCEYTCDKRGAIRHADGLLFHQRDLEAEFVRSGKKFEDWFKTTEQFPFKKTEEKLKNNPNQVWILWNDEATTMNKNFNSISQFFNWTLSYRTNSEIFEGSYGFFTDNSDLSETNTEIYKSNMFKNHAQRNNAILWFVSNCKSKLRSKLALEISRYYPVHIYGRCDLSDQVSSDQDLKIQYPYLKVFGQKKSCKRGSQCEEEKFRSYKYYLAFENRNRSDYITEKLWKALNKNMIPIVFQPSRISYRRYSIPPKSIIHLEDFENNIRYLANYLRRIDQDFNIYMNHIKWTFMYLRTVDESRYTEPHRMCQLCKQLNTLQQKVNYDRISDFFNDKCTVVNKK